MRCFRPGAAGARRWAPVVVLVVLVTACTPAGPDPGVAPPSIRPRPDVERVPVPGDAAYFGMHFSASVPDRQAAMTQLEEDLGRTVALDHVYHRFDAAFPTDYDRWTVDQGRRLFLSWSCRRSGGDPVRFADIASGELDDLIDARARGVAALGEPVLMSFCHEPSVFLGEDRAGTEAEYVAAWRHVVDRFSAAKVPVSWVWTLTAHAFRDGDPAALYPGDDAVDWIGVDGYVNVQCPWLDVPWKTWTETFEAANAFAAAREKPLVVAEFSLREDDVDPERKARWLAGAATEIGAMLQLRAVVGFNSVETCSDYVASTPAAMAGLRELALSRELSAE